MIVPARALGFLLIGAAGVVAGGLVAAVTNPLKLEHGSWVAAYLVLVVGVAQIGLGILQERLVAAPTSARMRASQLVTWNVGNAAVIGGTVAAAPFVVDAGGVLLVAALALFLAAQRGQPLPAGPHRTAAWVFRGLVLLLLVSIPVGLTLAHLGV